MTHLVTVPRQPADAFFALGSPFEGRGADGTVLGFSNYAQTRDGRPEFVVSAEMQYSRVHPDLWESSILKMKASGVNVITTYVLWNHHEPTRGSFDFTGRRDIRRFVELCAKHGVEVLLRIGPYVHSESRNGGLPDWLFGQPFTVRTLDQGWLDCTADLYNALGQQVAGLMFKDGGPVIGVQIDNEYHHSSSPWEVTNGMSAEWVELGNDGDAYMLALLDLAKQAGFDVPYYTATAWGGAVTSDQMMPMWGGYSYRPWLFYQPWQETQPNGEHPLTDEYIYQDFHSSAALEASSYELFDPTYAPETKPYTCCEMGGGMFNSYTYRFQLAFESVDAMANVKTASGCNYLGYYVFHGGSNPPADPPFLNETQVPNRQYDWSAPIGEWGQIRPSYRRLRLFHRFTRDYEDELTPLLPVLPEGQSAVRPDDLESLRYTLRSDGERGFLFVNNFQDHATMPAKSDESVEIALPGEVVRFDGIGLAENENCVLPFNLDLGGVLLKTATAQPVARVVLDGTPTHVFAIPNGMGSSAFVFEEGVSVDGGDHRLVRDGGVPMTRHEVVGPQGSVRLLVLDHATALRMTVVERPGSGQGLVFADDAVIQSNVDHVVSIETNGRAVDVTCVPPSLIPEVVPADDGLSAVASIGADLPDVEVSLTKASRHRWTLDFPGGLTPDNDADFLEIDYVADVGRLFVDGHLVHDNFANGDVWQVAVREFRDLLGDRPLTLVLAPLKEGTTINVDSPMAARAEIVDTETADLKSVSLKRRAMVSLPLV